MPAKNPILWNMGCLVVVVPGYKIPVGSLSDPMSFSRGADRCATV